MLKKILVAVLVTAVLLGLIGGWVFFAPGMKVNDRSRFLYVHTGKNTKADVMRTIEDSAFLKFPGAFSWFADKSEVWEKLRPGKYELKHGMSIFQLARKLRNNQQEPVNLVITKLRTKEQLAGLIGRRFETDSLAMLEYITGDNMKQYDLDSNTVMSAVFPDTYTYNWTASPGTIFEKLNNQYKKIWNEERKAKSKALGISPTQAYILASIIEEETNVQDDKPLMASVYLNRLKKGIRLGADPTVKFALKNFELRRIYEKHLLTDSPYNTYRYAGLPPGPICTPSLKTLDAVLDAPNTNYLYFVAKSDFSQRHVFTETYSEHMKYARLYQQALNKLQQQRDSASAQPGF
ncbi:MAG TPA: endolytic transglycosylase MltG [Flavitalea sp.]|nr:endolytic transglycosylase MltG [Flavitalea sp.]